jgi:intracellular septation protein A
MGIFIGFAPFIIYSVLVSNNSFEEAAVAALVTSIVLNGWSLLQGQRPKLLNLAMLGWFAILTVISLTGDDSWVADWSYVISNFAIAAIILFTILIGQPFTREYAEETVPEENWTSPVFLKATGAIAWAWFAALVLMGVSSYVAYQNPADEMWWNWIIPIGLFIAAFKFTEAYPARLRQQAGLPPQ